MTGGIEEQVQHNKVNTPKTDKVTANKQTHGNNRFSNNRNGNNRVDLNIVDKVSKANINSVSGEIAKGRENNVVNQVNLSLLDPGKMMIVPIQLGDVKTVALIDSGATVSLVKETVANDSMGQKVVVKGNNHIGGLASKQITILGLLDQTNISVHGITTVSVPLSVVKDTDVRHSVVLGRDFLQANNVVLRLAKNLLTFRYEGESRCDYYVGNESTPCKVIFSQVAVHAREQVRVHVGDNRKLRIGTSVDIASPSSCDYCSHCLKEKSDEFYFEGEMQGSSVKYVSCYSGDSKLCDSKLIEHSNCL